jgi:hypothetical protein
MKSSGTTPSERYLARLCERAFLSLWAYPNVYRNQGTSNGNGHGKEICDLLVVFGDDVIIFSDKSCAFKETGSIATDWSRWYRRAIADAENTVHGAARWIENHPDRVFLDRACKRLFPVPLPPKGRCRMHRVVIALGSREACRRHFGGGNGSLCVATSTTTKLPDFPNNIRPFVVGHTDASKAYVHIFDDVTLRIVLKELDTVADFCTYLSQKEQLVSSVTLLQAGGEEEIVANYLANMNEAGEPDFVLPQGGYDSVIMADGCWADFKNTPKYIAKKRADQESYLWDQLIERFAVTSPIDDVSSANPPYITAERALRTMASLNRVSRRLVSRRLIQLFDMAPEEGRADFKGTLLYPRPDLGFVFLRLPRWGFSSPSDYLTIRHRLLSAYCGALKLAQARLSEVVGVGLAGREVEPDFPDELLHCDVGSWTDKEESQALAACRRDAIFVDVVSRQISEDVYFGEQKPHRNIGDLTAPSWQDSLPNRRERRRVAALSRQKQYRS